jgi:hypothetical protein
MIRFILNLVFFFSVGAAALVHAQSTGDIESRIGKQSQLMLESKTADDIYTVKARIDKIADEAISTSKQSGIVRDAYLLMSEKLAEYSHYKSGSLVYFSYLEWQEKTHQLLKKEIQDSLGPNAAATIQQPPPVEEIETIVVPADTVVKDSSEANLTSSSTDIKSDSDAGGNHMTSMIILAVLLVAFTIVFISQRKKVSILKSELSNDQKEVRRLFRISTGVSMLSGVIRYAREFSLHCANVLADLIDLSKHDQQDAAGDLSKPNEAVEVFKRISNGEEKKA